MKLILDIVLLVIVALCTWGGYKRGLIGGIAGILAIIIALFGGSLVSSAYAHEVVPALEPFVDGYVDSQNTRNAILEKMGYANSELSVEDLLAQDTSLRYDYAYECLLSVGIYSERAEELAECLKTFGKKITVCESVADAVDAAKRLAGTDGMVCAFGSVYLAGAVRYQLGLY